MNPALFLSLPPCLDICVCVCVVIVDESSLANIIVTKSFHPLQQNTLNPRIMCARQCPLSLSFPSLSFSFSA